MAGVSTKEIKNRIRSMEATRQITKAMEMVAASKLRRAQAQVAASRPYFEILRATIDDIVRNDLFFSSPYLKERPVGRVLYIVIAGDRGLAGGYNSNILKLVMGEIKDKDATVLPIGKRCVDYFKSHNVPVLTNSYAEAADVSIGDCFSISRQLCNAYKAEDFDEIRIAYTNFVSVLSQTPVSMQILPLVCENADEKRSSTMVTMYEPNEEAVFEVIVPEYLGGVLYGALWESRASEAAARRTAMDTATSNAEDMIADLRQTFNRARQAAITQEITEIVAGS